MPPLSDISASVRSARCLPAVTASKRRVNGIGRDRLTVRPRPYSQSLRLNTQYSRAPEPIMITRATMKPIWLLKPGYGTFIP